MITDERRYSNLTQYATYANLAVRSKMQLFSHEIYGLRKVDLQCSQIPVHSQSDTYDAVCVINKRATEARQIAYSKASVSRHLRLVDEYIRVRTCQELLVVEREVPIAELPVSKVPVNQALQTEFDAYFIFLMKISNILGVFFHAWRKCLSALVEMSMRHGPRPSALPKYSFAACNGCIVG